MKRTIHWGLLAALLLSSLVLSACDSNEKPLSDAEDFFGTWAITGFFDDTGDRSDVIANGFAGVHLEFRSDGTGWFAITPKTVPARMLPTAFMIDEERNFITLSVSVADDEQLPLELSYNFELRGKKVRFHTTHSSTLNTIFECDLAGDVTVVASKFEEVFLEDY